VWPCYSQEKEPHKGSTRSRRRSMMRSRRRSRRRSSMMRSTSNKKRSWIGRGGGTG